ncbi:MAG: hypothetical protein D6805_02090, partial [Planctomycetota bacterium]
MVYFGRRSRDGIFLEYSERDWILENMDEFRDSHLLDELRREVSQAKEILEDSQEATTELLALERVAFHLKKEDIVRVLGLVKAFASPLSFSRRLELILDQAIVLVGAQRAFLLLKEGEDPPKVLAGRTVRREDVFELPRGVLGEVVE